MTGNNVKSPVFKWQPVNGTFPECKVFFNRFFFKNITAG